MGLHAPEFLHHVSIPEWQSDLADDRAGIRRAERVLLECVARRYLPADEAQELSRHALRSAGSLSAILSRARDIQCDVAEFVDEVELIGGIVDALHRRHIENVPLHENDEPLAFYARARLWPLNRRELHIYLLDADGYLIGEERIAVGTIEHVAIYPREVIGRALLTGASYVYLASNAPGDRTKPNSYLLSSTNRVREGCEGIGINFCCHLLVTRFSTIRV